MSLIRQNTADSLNGDAVVNANDNNSSPHPGSPAAHVSERATRRPTLTINSQQGQHNEKANHATTAGAATWSAKAIPKNNNVIAFTLNWICVVLTVTAAIVFGIWAPLSYRATADGNRDNNEVQYSMMHQIMTANGIASSALDAVSAQCTALESMEDRLRAMGQLAMVDFCVTQTAVTACSYFASIVPLTSVLSYLASDTPPSGTTTSISLSSSSSSTFYQTAPMSSPTLSSTQSEAATPYPKSNNTINLPSPSSTQNRTTTTSAKSQDDSEDDDSTLSSTVSAITTAGPLTTTNMSHSLINSPTPSSSVSTIPTISPSTAANTSHLPVEAVLGIVFGSLTFLGLGAGFFVWRLQKEEWQWS